MDREPVDLMIEHAAELVTCAGPAGGRAGRAVRDLEVIQDGAVAVRDGRIVAAGPTRAIVSRYSADKRVDATGCLVSPGLVDPHSHLLYAGSRHDEWEHKATGRGTATGLQGGIHRSVEWTRAAADEALVAQAVGDLDEMLAHGTTTLEAKTGYGLDRETELRLLRLTAGLDHPIEVVPTFLGAHVPPPEYADDLDAYVDLVIDLLPEAAPLAEYCDVCCDPVGFTAEQCRRIGTRARELGMGIRVHSDQTGDAGGAFVAAELEAASADHADYTTPDGFRAMAAAGTVAILFPSVTYHMLEMVPRPTQRSDELAPPEKPFMPLVPARAEAAGCVVALSTDYNPGSSPTLSMQAVMQIAARLFRLGYAEIWNMCTLNAAASLDRGHDRGSLEPGKRADIVVWRVPEHGMVVHRFGTNMVRDVWIEGRRAVASGHPVDRRAATV